MPRDLLLGIQDETKLNEELREEVGGGSSTVAGGNDDSPATLVGVGEVQAGIRVNEVRAVLQLNSRDALGQTLFQNCEQFGNGVVQSRVCLLYTSRCV